MKGEEQLFKKYFYFICKGINRYSLSEDNSFDAYSDTIIAAIKSVTNGSFQGKSWQNLLILLRKKVHESYDQNCQDQP